MGQTATKAPPSGFGTLQLQDLWKGFVKTTGGLIIGIVIKMISDKAFPSYDQLVPFLEASVYFLASYLGFNAVTNNVGEMFKSDKPVVTVGQKSLDKLEAKADDAGNT